MAISKAMTPFPDDLPTQEPIEVDVVPDDQYAEEQSPQPEPYEPKHTDNLAEFIEESSLVNLASELFDLYQQDEQTRADWIRTYTKGLDYLGFKTSDRTSPFKGSSGVYHPVMTEAVIRFQSNAIIELFPASGPALTKTLGEETPDKAKQAQRVKEELNYQLQENMGEFRNETEQLLFRLPLAGSVFKKTYYEPLKQRMSSCMVTAEDFVVDYGSSDIDSVERFTHVQRKTHNQLKKLMRIGFYSNIDLPKPTPDSPPEGKEKEDKLMGREPNAVTDNRHVILEFHVHINLPPPFDDPDEIADPYVVTIEKDSLKVLSIYRNWKPDDEARNPEQYFTHYQYMPGLGFYGLGLIHVMGSIAKAATAIMRQLIDAGTLANLPGGLKTRGLRTKGDDEPIQPGEWRDVDVPAGSIAQNIFAMPYKDPSSVMVALLDKLIEEGRRIGSIADVEIGATQANAPVGTTMALMERSLKVMSAVHARLHASFSRELKLIASGISEYMPPQYDWDTEGKYNRAEDFDGRVDIIPVSDPNAATKAQRIVEMQAIIQLYQLNPEYYNGKELHRKALQDMGIKGDERLLPVDEPPPYLDPVSENMALLVGQPIKVYPEQDHTAHIQSHLAFGTDPKTLEMFQNSPKAPAMQGAMEAHLAEHLGFQYRAEMEEQMGVELPPIGESLPPEVEAKLSRAIADAGQRLRDIHTDEAQQKQNEEALKDPVWQLRNREITVKERAQVHKENKDLADLVVQIATEAANNAIEMRDIEGRERMKGAEIGANLVTFGAQLESDERKEGVTLGVDIAHKARDDLRESQRLAQEASDAAAERQNRIDVQKAKPKPKPASKK